MLFSILLSLVAGLATADTDAAKVFHGATYVESYDQVMVIAVDSDGTGKRDGIADTAFVVATPNGFAVPVSFRWEKANVVFKASGLMITAPETGEALIVTFKRDVPRATFAAPSSFRVTRVSDAIGLAHHSTLAGIYEMDRMPTRNSSATMNRVASESWDSWKHEPMQNNWDTVSAGGGGGGCTSGGSGSTSCSIGGCVGTEGRNDCAVSCITGYYACCNCGNCQCLRYDGRP